MDQDFWDDENLLPGEFYAQVILTLCGDASTPASRNHCGDASTPTPLLADPRLAALVAQELTACASRAPGQCWGYVVLPEEIRLVVGLTTDRALDTFIEHVKTRTTHRLVARLYRHDSDTLDRILRYNPVRGGVEYRVWQAGMHRTVLWTEYKLSNALYELRQSPVAAGLVDCAEAWPFIGCMA